MPLLYGAGAAANSVPGDPPRDVRRAAAMSPAEETYVVANAAIASAGLYHLAVFPVVERGKTPLTATGFKAATRDTSQVREWWSKRPDANICVACGESGLLVVDVDPRNGVNETLRRLE